MSATVVIRVCLLHDRGGRHRTAFIRRNAVQTVASPFTRRKGETHDWRCAPAERLDAVTEVERAFILQAALRVFARDGLRETRVRAIATEAGYAAGGGDPGRRGPGRPGIWDRSTAAGPAFFDFHEQHSTPATIDGRRTRRFCGPSADGHSRTPTSGSARIQTLKRNVPCVIERS